MTESTQRLDALFDLRYGHSLELNALTRVEAPAGVNFVSRAMGNNGVTARVESSIKPAAAGEMSVALGGNGVLSTFVQPEPFVCGRDVMILSPKQKNMTLQEKLWWAQCIWANKYRFSYGRQANRTLGSLEVPATVPSWVLDTPVPTYEGLSRPAAMPVELSDPAGPTWRAFRLDSLFSIKKGRRVTKAQRSAGDVPFVGASERNNGITDHSNLTAQHPAGTITVAYNGNSVGFAFPQPAPYFACDDVNVLYPLAPMDLWVQLFVCAVIRYERTRYTYGYKWTLARMKATTIRLPSQTSGQPDWEYMRGVMKGLPFSAALEGALSESQP